MKVVVSVDVLSDGCLLLGVVFGDRLEEYFVINWGFDDRGECFCESIEYICLVLKGFG